MQNNQSKLSFQDHDVFSSPVIFFLYGLEARSPWLIILLIGQAQSHTGRESQVGGKGNDLGGEHVLGDSGLHICRTREVSENYRIEIPS